MSESEQGTSPKVSPILFSPAMVRALIEGRKMQTRRIIDPKPCKVEAGFPFFPPVSDETGCSFTPIPCPYGQAGDLLWCREPWQAWAEYDDRQPSEIPEGSDILYVADREDMLWDARRRHAKFMCRWMSRLTLELTDLRVQRLQEISEEDALAEGILQDTVGNIRPHFVDQEATAKWPDDKPLYFAPEDDEDDCLQSTAAKAFQRLWGIINNADSWDENPWVWALTFRVHRQNVDVLLKQREAV